MPDKDSLQQAEVTIVDACCCYYDGFLFGDGCLGCMGSTTMCCLEEEFCCKQGADPLCLYCCACRFVIGEAVVILEAREWARHHRSFVCR